MMDKRQLQHTILEEQYNQVAWQVVLREYFGATTIHRIPNRISLPANDIAESAFELGSFFTVDDRLVGLYEVQVNPKPWIEINRIGLRNLLKRVYQTDTDAALIVFAQGSKWRFSYVSEIRTKEGKKQTEPKRYTYLFGKGEACRTAADRFDKLKGKPIYLDDLFEAFSVEKLNREFFKTYKEFYERFWKYLNSESTYQKILIDTKAETEDLQQKPIRDFVKKLLGRIVFLQFLQKKGWMGVNAGSTNWEGGDIKFLQNLFAEHKHKEKFHSTALRTLFFETLNIERKNDIAPASLGREIKIPYLNGGLFDKDISFDKDIDFPEEYFKSLLDFFEQYNFTIDENDPYDSEVGIDPEMLGHIFENLLEENKDKGTFYTPKEIVTYICKASLIEYLKEGLRERNILISLIEGNAIEDFIRYNQKGDESSKKNFIRQHASLIEELLDDVKICDPAIGSGAFPMGMMQEIVNAKLNLDWTLDPTLVKKSVLQNSIYGVDIDNGAIDIARLRFWLALVVNEDEPHPLPNLDYKIIQGNSLREDFEGIRLDRLLKGKKLSYVNKHGEQDIFGKDDNPKNIEEISDENKVLLINLLHKFFQPKSLEEKKTLQKKIDNIILNHIEYNIELDERAYKKELDEELEILSKIKVDRMDSPGQAKKKQVNQDKVRQRILELRESLRIISDKRLKLATLEKEHDNKPYFLWNVFFGDVIEKGGFDIIIGNPPYGAKLTNDEKILYKQLYSDVHIRTQDSFNYFISKSLRLLRPNGVLSFIVPNNLLFQNENFKTRDLLINQNHLKSVVNLGDNTFESADVPTCIFVVLKVQDDKYKLNYSDYRNLNIKEIPFFTPESETSKDELNQVPQLVMGVSSHNIRMMQSFNTLSWKIDELVDEVAYGVSSGSDKVYRIPIKEAEKLRLEKELLHKVISGREINRFNIVDSFQYIIYVSRDTDLEKYPHIESYLTQFKDILIKRSEAKDGIIPWFALLRHRHPSLFANEKIVMRQTDDTIRAAFDTTGLYTMDSVVNIKLKENSVASYKYCTAVLNSTLSKFIYRQLTQEEGRVFAQVKPQNVRKLLIPKISKKEQKIFEDLCDYLIFLNDDSNPSLSSLVPNVHIGRLFEEVIDGCVYECYFGDHMRQKQINILENVREIIKPIDDIESKEAKAIVINEMFQELRKSQNQIRNRIQLFVSASPEYLKNIIQQ